MGYNHQLLELCKTAHRKNWILSLSSSYETGIGLHQIALLANHLNISFPLGIDTYQDLSKDLLVTPHILQKGQMMFSPIEMCYDCIQEVSFV